MSVRNSSWSQLEMLGCRIWDGRCRSSLISICQALFEGCGLSLSSALGPRLRQSVHRIAANSKTTITGLLAGHVQQTAIRGSGAPLILVAQDTTEIDYSSHPSTEGLGPMRSCYARGLLAHCALAMLPDGTPLGVVSLAIWARDPNEIGKTKTRNHKNTKDKESQKWLDGVSSTESAFGPEQSLLIIQDREADMFALLAVPRRANTYLLVRTFKPRMVKVEDRAKPVKLLDAIDRAPVLGTFEASIPRRANKKERTATLALQLREMTALPPANQLPGEVSEPQRIWVIKATEVDTLEGEEPICWILVSTLPATTLEDGIQLVKYYTCRWMIERLHYTLKSGCQIEKLQIDNAASIKNILALYYVVAWRVMYLTYQGRSAPQDSPSVILSSVELEVLSKISKSEILTMKAAVTVLAKMGGYQGYKDSPPPGVKVIWIGLRKLEAMVEYHLALQT